MNALKNKYVRAVLVLLYLGLWMVSESVRIQPEVEPEWPTLSDHGSLKHPIIVFGSGGCLQRYGNIEQDGTGVIPLVWNLKESGGSVSDTVICASEILKDEEHFHVVARGYGVTLALKLAADFPEKIISMVLIEPKGLAEFERLGNALLDRSLRWVESLFYWGLDRLIPFSWIMDFSISERFWVSRLVSQSDLDDTRMNARSINRPVVIVSDERADTQAGEFHRIIPQSAWLNLENKRALIRFWKECEAVKNQSIAGNSSRIEFSNIDYNLLFRKEFEGIALVVAMTLIALSTLISEDLACIGSGILVSQGGIAWSFASIACFSGIYLGDMLIFSLGWVFGEVLMHRKPFCWFLSTQAVENSELWFKRKGLWVLAVSRFLPGTRVPAYFAAGVLKSKVWQVSLILGGAALVWVPGIVYVSSVVGAHMLKFFEKYEQWVVLGIVIVFGVIFFITHHLLPLLTYRGRRLAYSRWKRFTRWEFWPAKVIYPPVVLYILYLGIRYRSLSLCTLVNPMIPCGGLVDESKILILKNLQQAGAPVAPFIELDPGLSTTELVQLVNKAQDNWKKGFPVVIKPDHGERGKGVMIVKSQEELVEVLSTLETLHVAQSYVSGQEFGVFYYRFPGEPHGTICSITRKQFISVTGDGISDLEHLILKDARAVCSAQVFLKNHADQCYRIPADGEEVKLVEIGTHSRGSLFLDAGELLTQDLLNRLDMITSSLQGFYFGRFDLKVPGDKELQNGESIQIIELNLLTSEPTHIYDPQHSLVYAWKALFKQWRIAFEISAINRTNGLRPLPVFQVIKIIFRHFLKR